MRLDISIEELFPVPIERVWQALTDPQMITRWLMAVEGFEARVGARFILRDPPSPGFRGYVECEILELSPPRRMVWSWSSSAHSGPTRVVIELKAHANKTRLTLSHTGDADERTVRGTSDGWPRKLRQLSRTLRDTSPPNHEDRRRSSESAQKTEVREKR